MCQALGIELDPTGAGNPGRRGLPRLVLLALALSSGRRGILAHEILGSAFPADWPGPGRPGSSSAVMPSVLGRTASRLRELADRAVANQGRHVGC